MANNSTPLFLGLAIFAVAVTLAIALPNLPIHPPPGGGGEPTPTPTPTPPPTVTLQTAVTISLGWTPGSDPEIKSIYTWKVSGQTVSEPAGIQIFPWKGKLKLEIVYPSGKEASYVKEVKIDLGQTKTYYFTWQTQESGKHFLIASLINGEGAVVDQKQSEVDV